MKFNKLLCFLMIGLLSISMLGCFSNPANTPTQPSNPPLNNEEPSGNPDPKPEPEPEPDPIPDEKPAQPVFTQIVVNDEEINVVMIGESYDIVDVQLETTEGTIQSANIRDLQLTLSGVDKEEVILDDDGTLHIQEEATIGRSFTVSLQYKELQASIPYTIKYSLESTIEDTGADIPVVTNPNHSVVIVNKQRSLPEGFIPENLIEPNVPFSFNEEDEKRQLREEAAHALEALFAQAEEDGIEIYAVSGYRSYARQKYLFERYVREQGEEYARRYSAYPGTSEHQTGLAMDVSSPSVGNKLIDTFGNTAEGIWLAENAHHHGFVIRYLECKEEITGYAYEPWHLRFVGKDLAADTYEAGITLEEYFNTQAIPVNQ